MKLLKGTVPNLIGMVISCFTLAILRVRKICLRNNRLFENFAYTLKDQPFLIP